MRTTAPLIALTALFFLMLTQVGHAATEGYDNDERQGNLDLEACSPPVDTRLAGRLYSYQMPILIRNELSPAETIWAYADACVKAPDGWVPGQWVDRGLREGKTWASLEIYQAPRATHGWPHFRPRKPCEPCIVRMI